MLLQCLVKINNCLENDTSKNNIIKTCILIKKWYYTSYILINNNQNLLQLIDNAWKL